MQGKRTNYCNVRIEVLNLFLGEKLCIKLVKSMSINRRYQMPFDDSLLFRWLTFIHAINFFGKVK